MRSSLLLAVGLVLVGAGSAAAQVSFACRLDHPPHLLITGVNKGRTKYCRWVCWFKLLDNPYTGFVKSNGYEKLAGTRAWTKTGDDSIDWTTVNWRCLDRPPAQH